MSDSSSASELPGRNDDVLELNKNLERMVEDTENMSAQLTWMAYDMVALRTNPEEGASMRQLEEAYQRCRAAVFGDSAPEPEGETDSASAKKPAEM